MSVLAQRVVTASVLVGLLIWVLYFMPPLAAIVCFAVFLLLGSWEWSGLVAPGYLLPRVFYVVGLALLAWLSTMASQPGFYSDVLLWGALTGWFLVAGWMLGGYSVLPLWAAALAGVVALVPAWYSVMRLLASEQGSSLFVWVATIVAAADTGAYFVGRSFGRTKLAPAISPGKTREGMLGGIALAAVAGAGGAAFFGQSPAVFALGGAAIALVSVVGDLLVSACKRRAGLKDSGWILPGHGGVLDRIDGLLAALPLFVLLLVQFGLLGQEFSLTR